MDGGVLKDGLPHFLERVFLELEEMFKLGLLISIHLELDSFFFWLQLSLNQAKVITLNNGEQ